MGVSAGLTLLFLAAGLAMPRLDAATTTTATAPTRGAPPFAERFAAPGSETRILKIIHGWPDDPTQQDGIVSTLKRQGFGGVVCNISFTGYLEDAGRWRSFERGVSAAADAGMAMWLYDERGYPSGNAGGLVMKGHPEWEARGLLVADAEVRDGKASLTLPPGRVVLCAAFPIHQGRIDSGRRVDLRDRIRDGSLTWEAPAGAWRLIAITEDRLYDGTHADMNLWEKIPYVNLLQAEPTRRFLELTHDRYAEHLGSAIGQRFQATFTDEPSLMSLFFKRMPYRPLPWSAELPGEFLQRRGYPLEPILPSLVADTGHDAPRHRYDYWLTIGELVSENFFGQIQAWGRRHGLPSGGHLLAEEMLTSHVALYGDFFRCLRRMDAPGIDCLTSLPQDVPWYIARMAASAADLDGHPLVMCETSDHSQVYRPDGDKRPRRVVTEVEIRGTCNRLFVAGVNCITSYYSFTDLADDALRRLNEWAGRCGLLLRGGHQVADVAVVYPAESLWTQFVPAAHWALASPGANRIDGLFRGALESLYEARYEHTVIDSRTLVEAQVRDGALVHGPHRWRVVVLPGMDILPLAAWRKLDRFASGGGLLVALAARPANTEAAFPSAEVQRLGRRWFGDSAIPGRAAGAANGSKGLFLPPGSEALLAPLLAGMVEPSVSTPDATSPIRSTHRRVENHDVYFLINDSPRPWQGNLTLNGAGAGERLDPASGAITKVPGPGPQAVSLEPYGAVAFRFDAVKPFKRLSWVRGRQPALDLQELPAATPVVSRGEFVREQLDRMDAVAAGERSGWRAQATLTKGQVDTFLFVRLPYTQPLDLSRARALELETWVPEGQATGTQLLVILHERDGGDFLATTSRTLNAAGHEQTLVPFHAFQLAGWSQDADGVLDLKRVDEIRIGWGGYHGREREDVTFRMAPPRLGLVR